MVDEGGRIQEYFEEGFLDRPLGEQVREVERYYLYSRICEMAAAHQPLLEAGCGPGQWVAMAAAHGWEAIGVDWSPALMQRAAAQVPNATFLVGDLRKLPVEDESIGSIMSLGAIEHAIEGPEVALSEFWRVLAPDGVALITVPFLGSVRRVVWAAGGPIWYSPWLRRLLRRERGRRPLRRAGARRGWTADFMAASDGWSFFQYQFDKPTMSGLLQAAGFVVDEEFVFGPDEGLVQTFNRAAGRYNNEGGFKLTILGRFLRRVLRPGTYEHMLGYMVHKPS